MQKNEAVVDWWLRATIGVIALLVAVLAPIGVAAQVVLFVVAAIGLATGIAGFCPLYRLFGVSTCRTLHA